jgi:hypothetical protein
VIQVANVPTCRDSFDLRVRDRATRLRSSDVQHSSGVGIPFAKDRDVVAIQLELFLTIQVVL